MKTIAEGSHYYIYGGGILLGFLVAVYLENIKRITDETSNKIYNSLQRVIQYSLAYSISVYGFAKILKTQFVVSESIKDIPLGAQNGFALTWHYFGYSYAFAVIIGLTQLIGSALLLFNSTRLLGTFILLPVMINIVLINIFYEIALGAFLNSLIYTISLLFLMLLNYNELLKLFFPTIGQKLDKTVSGIFLVNAIRIMTIVLHFFLTIYLLKKHFQFNSNFKGVYEVETINKNNVDVETDLKDSVLTKIYFEYPVQATLECNGYKRRENYYYKLDEDAKVISLLFDE